MIVAPLIVPVSIDTARASWNGDAGATVRVFVNGRLVFGPQAIAEAAKAVEVALPPSAIVEVHESDASDTVPGAAIELARRPLLWWQSVPGAFRYRVTIGGVFLGVVLHEESRLHHEVVVLQDVRVDGGAWSTFKVEAETESGRLSTTPLLALFVPGAPVVPSDVDVTGTGGTFDIEVTQ